MIPLRPDAPSHLAHRDVIRLTRKYPWSAVHPSHRAAISYLRVTGAQGGYASDSGCRPSEARRRRRWLGE